MGAIAAYLLKYGKVMLAWGILVSALAVFYSAINNSGALSTITQLQSTVVSSLADIASAIPLRVADVNDAISASLDDGNGMADLLYWMAGLDVLQSILTYLIAQVNTIVATVVGVGTTALLFAGLLWVLRKTQRYIQAISGGELIASFTD